MFSIDKIDKVRKKFPWSILGVAIGIIGLSYAIYIDQFKQDKPNIIFEVIANTQVLNVNEDLNELDILYKGKNLKEKKESLILITVKIRNSGERDIVERDFSKELPFGFRILNGQIAEKPQIIDASNEFLTNFMTVEYDSTNLVYFNKTQLDRAQYFVVKVLTICKENELPTIRPIGKVSGRTDNFFVQEIVTIEESSDMPLFKRINNDKFWIHFIRFFYYILVMALFSFVVILPISKLFDYFGNKKKDRLVGKYQKKANITLTDYSDLIFKIFKDYGESKLDWLHNILHDSKRLLKLIKKYKIIDGKYQFIEQENVDLLRLRAIETGGYRSNQITFDMLNSNIMNLLLDNNAVSLDKSKKDVNIDKQFINELKEFKYFLDLQ